MPLVDEICFAYNLATPFKLMKFTLTYQGELRAQSSSGTSRCSDKWEIRNQLHPQLQELWNTHSVLKNLANFSIIPKDQGYFQMVGHHSQEGQAKREVKPTEIDLLAPMELGGKKFIPLVRDSMALVCELDILFLRKEEPGKLIKQGGDIDNRIKTLLDGLRMPNDVSEVTKDCKYDSTYCLLENDSLITGLNVKTDRLLDADSNKNHAVKLIIGVTINVIHVRPYNLPLIGF